MDTVWLTWVYVLFLIEVGSRRVHLAGCTYSPSAEWVVQQARNLAWKLQDGALKAKFLLYEGLEVHDRLRRGLQDRGRGGNSPTVPGASCERLFGALGGHRQARVSDRLLIVGRRHLEKLLTEFIDHYNNARPHQGIDQRRPCEPDNVVVLPTGQIERRDRLGGIIHEYSQKAA